MLSEPTHSSLAAWIATPRLSSPRRLAPGGSAVQAPIFPGFEWWISRSFSLRDDGRYSERTLGQQILRSLRSQRMTALIIVGRIRKAHGVRGDVVVEPITDDPDAIFSAGR